MNSLLQRIGDAPAPQLPTHPEIADWRPASDGDVDAIHRVRAAADAVDHPTWITPREDIVDNLALSHLDHARDTLLAVDANGVVVAYAEVLLHPSRDGELVVYLGGAVHPDVRRRGIGGALLTWSTQRALEHLAEVAAGIDAPNPDDWKLSLKVYAGEQQHDLIALAEHRGLRPVRWFTTMLRDMRDDVADLPAIEAVRIVAFTHNRDLDAMAARNDAFRDHWGSLPSDPERWMQFVGGEFFRPDLSRLAVDADDRIIAFCLASVNEADFETLGASNSYIDLIGVVRDHRGEGLAPRVIAATLTAIRDAGLEKAVLDVDTASPTGANTLYERLGFAATEREVALAREL